MMGRAGGRPPNVGRRERAVYRMSRAVTARDETDDRLRALLAFRPPVIAAEEEGAFGALAALAAGDTARGLDLARAASRDAGAVANEAALLANLTLARARRHAGKPQLAVRILSALAPSAPLRWRPWLAWEMALAGGAGPAAPLLAGAPTAASPPTSVPAGPAALLLAFLDRLGGGERQSVDASAATLLASLDAGAWFADEARDLLALLDLRREPTAAMRPWRDGAAPLPPRGLHGVAAEALAKDPRDQVHGYVAVDAEGAASRVLRLGLPLLRADGAARPATTLAGQARPLTGLAALALAGAEGLDQSAFFRTVYGFAFVAERHQAIVNSLVYRMRQVVADAGEVDRDRKTERFSLRVRQPMIIPDPRCVQPSEDRLIGYLARAGGVSAEAAATMLQLPVRTVQAVLQQLVADGVCRPVRSGRNINYLIEDTTFSPAAAPPPRQ